VGAGGGGRKCVNTDEERALAAAARGGDREAAARLCDALRPMVCALAREHAGAVDEADLRQEGFAAVLVLLRTFDATRGPLSHYARASVRGVMLDATDAAVRARAPTWDDGVTHDTPEGAAMAAEMAARARAGMTPHEAAVLALRHRGLPWAEVAARLGLSIAAARQAGSRGIRGARARIAK
jgi:RNA polymerase sigma factor (sigma-70 family)